jgi:predicted metal-dependent hydrolase
MRAAMAEGEKFLESKKDWIQKRLTVHIETDERFFYLGREIAVTRVFEDGISKNIIKFNQNVLGIRSPKISRISDKALYEKWLRIKGEEIIPRRTEFLARTNNFKVRKISIRNQKTRWGSCSISGALSFNFKLMQFREEVIDYVIIHELCHLAEMNHSRKFWNIVGSIVPEYKSLRKELKLFNRTKKEELL